MTLSPLQSILDSIREATRSAMQNAGYNEFEPALDNAVGLSEGFGDISCNIAFRIAKSIGRKPADVASSIISGIGSIEAVKGVKEENGFINFYLDRKKFTALVMEWLLGGRSNAVKSEIGSGKAVVVESPSANPVHPLHMGQVRNALIGNVLANMYAACGYRVEREDYIDDLGFQVAQAVWGLMHLEELGIEINPNGKFDHEIGKVYVEVNKYAETHEIKEDIAKVLALMEQDGTYESVLCRDSAEKYVMAEYETLFELNIYHDLLVWESDIIREKLFEKAMKIMEDKGVIDRPKEGKYSGCAIISFDRIKDLPEEFRNLKENVKVLVRSNGTPDYVAKDIAFHMWKFGIFEDSFKYREFVKQPNGSSLYTTSEDGKRMDFGNADMAVNPIDTRQSFEQSFVRSVIDSIGYPEKARNLKHLAYGVVDIEGAKLAGRKGTWLGYTADDLIREARERAYGLIGARFETSQDERASIAAKVALAAIRFEFLRLSNEKKLNFSWATALNFEGRSGPYCQYMFARANRILENYGNEGALYKSAMRVFGIEDDLEFELVKKMSGCVAVLERSCRELKPNLLVEYAGELALLFGKFYEHKNILKLQDEEEKLSRLEIVACFKIVMEAVLAVLGVEPLSKM